MEVELATEYTLHIYCSWLQNNLFYGHLIYDNDNTHL